MIGTDFRNFEIYLHRGVVDFRRGLDGMSALVQDEMGFDPFDHDRRRLFVFTNRTRKRIRILYWDRTGFALWMKRLEEARFPWPKAALENRGSVAINLTREELSWLLEGYEFWRLKPHRQLEYARVS